MSDGQAIPPPSAPPVSSFTGPVAELIQQRMLMPPSRPGLLAVLDHYEILRIVGGGGMGIVLLARPTGTSREVAIKLVRSDLVSNQEVIHRFLKEAGHLKRLRHANIVPVEEISDRAEGPYFVMPFYEKGSLASRIKPGQPLDTGTILDIATQVAEGLAFAHRSGIIHRDLKPANILLGAAGAVCLGDFGLARTMFNDSILEVENRRLEGTAPYMSPGVADGNAEDTRCDIYSFGGVLYEMLTGLAPYQGRGTTEILDQILAGPPKSITALNPDADRGLVAMAEKAMARELRDRYAEMRDALNDLQRVRAGKSPLAGGTNKGLARAVVPLSALAGVILLALLGWTLWPKAPSPGKLAPQPVATPVTPPQVTPPPVAKAPVVAPPVIPTPVVTPQPVVITHQPVAPPVVTPPATPPPSPKIITLAGQVGNGGFEDGSGTQSLFHLPNNVAVDSAGNVYVADTANDVIRKITPEGVVSTFAGQPGKHGSTDGAGSRALFFAPFGVAVDGSGNVYVADTGNNIIRKITPGGVVSTLAGTPGHPGSADGLRGKAQFRNPWDVAADRTGNVLVADMSNDTIRKITPDGEVTTLAGLAGASGSADGSRTNARFCNPFGVAADGAGNVYVSDSANNAIRKISPDGMVATLAGLPGYAGLNDGESSSARFSNPQGLAVDGAGNLYVADTGNNTVRKITAEGVVTTLPGLADTSNLRDASAAASQLNSPGGVAVDDAGNIYAADTVNQCIRKIPAAK